MANDKQQQRQQEQQKHPQAPSDPQAPAAQLTAGSHAAATWLIEAEKYLSDAGWELIGRTAMGEAVWNDPAGSLARAQPTLEVELPKKGGGFETIKQMVGPPAPWRHRTTAAVAIQKQRDAAGGLATPLARLHSLERRHDKLRQQMWELTEQLKKIYKRTPPEKEPGLKLEVQALYQMARELSTKGAAALDQDIKASAVPATTEDKATA